VIDQSESSIPESYNIHRMCNGLKNAYNPAWK